jgi:hypothetical protein
MRRYLVAIGAAAVAASLPTAVLAIVFWSMTGTPPAAVVGQPTTFTLTVTSQELLTRVGCVEVNVTGAFDTVAVGVVSTPPDSEWHANHSGSIVTAQADGGGDRLRFLESMQVSVTAIPLTPGVHAWSGTAWTDHQCGGSALLGAPSFTIAVAMPPSPTPSPTPSPVPTIAPTPTPTPSHSAPPPPSPTPPPTPTPTRSAAPGVEPTDPAPLPAPSDAAAPPGQPAVGEDPSPRGTSDGRSPSPRASATPRPSAAGDAGGPQDPGGGPDGGGARPNRAMVIEGLGPDVNLGGLSLLDQAGLWVVPGAVVGVPGLLVILWVALQTGGAMAWIPAVRRLRRDDRRRRRAR